MTSPSERTAATFETSSPDEAVAILGETYAHTDLHHRQQPVGTVMRISQHTLTEDVRLDDLELGLGFTAEDQGVTVTAVATRWGFANPGRFATQFRAAHGTTPSEVLRAC